MGSCRRVILQPEERDEDVMYHLGIRRVIFPFGISLIFLFLMSTPGPTQASTLFDPEFDVKYENTGEKGRFWENIDIRQVDTEGSIVIITCGTPLPLRESGFTFRYLVMFSDDGNPTDWEAAIIVTSLGENTVELSWKIGPVTFEEAVGLNDWIKYYDMAHYQFVDNSIRLSFPEYPSTAFAEMAVWTEVVSTDANGNRHIFHDWAPDSWEDWSFEAAEEVVIEEPPSEEPSSEPTSEPERSTGSSITSSSIIPGFGLLSMMVIVPLLFFKKRRQKRR